ncbi:MAG TPA: hypothetical protein VLI92_04860 [Candidatus Saccharimonadales bacterium]|nr:hypothetical protein [Candidatus Saccharimonadales bacterium]
MKKLLLLLIFTLGLGLVVFINPVIRSNIAYLLNPSLRDNVLSSTKSPSIWNTPPYATPNPTVSILPTEGARGIPFGAYGNTVDLFGNPFTGGLISLKPNDFALSKSVLDQAKAKKVRVVIALVGERTNFQNADKSFSLSKWKAQLDRWKDFDFSPYISSGTIIGFRMIDEPQDSCGNWNCKPIPYSDIEAAAAYSKSLWPKLPTGVGSNPCFLKGGAPWKSLDFVLIPFTEKKLNARDDCDNVFTNAADFAKKTSAQASAIGLKFALDPNVTHGGTPNGNSITAANLESDVRAFSAMRPCAVLMWDYDQSYFSQSSVSTVVNRLATLLSNLPSSSCSR